MDALPKDSQQKLLEAISIQEQHIEEAEELLIEVKVQTEEAIDKKETKPSPATPAISISVDELEDKKSEKDTCEVHRIDIALRERYPHTYDATFDSQAFQNMITFGDEKGKVRENGGIVLGTYDHDDKTVHVTHFIPMKESELRGSAHLNFTPEDWAYLNNEWDRLNEALRTLGEREVAQVGWFHTHPGHGTFLSGGQLDLLVHQYFIREDQLAIVYDPQNQTLMMWNTPKEPPVNEKERIVKEVGQTYSLPDGRTLIPLPGINIAGAIDTAFTDLFKKIRYRAGR
jgi:proteasome lid subunit RPN8/RPN11